MFKRNPHFETLPGRYLFEEINQRKKEFLQKNPEAQLISLGIGDTTQPLPPTICKALVKAAQDLGTHEGYRGYGNEHGIDLLRERISQKIYQKKVSPDEIFISDGAKCDIGRLQILFGDQISVAIQDPAYPVYVDGSLLRGVKNIVYLPCTPENSFFPDLEKAPRTDLIYFCSPNNPTGVAATFEQLEKLVSFAKKNKSLIIFDAAYSHFIKDDSCPRSIYEIEGARDVAIETNSFSKLAGFTGVRLGWTVVPENLKYENGYSIRSDWNRLMTTLFNGASNIAQHGGLAVLEKEGMEEVNTIIEYYRENAALLKKAFENKGYQVFGGVHAPYLWVSCPGQKSWEVFQKFLDKAHLIVTPGSGFGQNGEGFIRLTAFGQRSQVLQAVNKIF